MRWLLLLRQLRRPLLRPPPVSSRLHLVFFHPFVPAFFLPTNLPSPCLPSSFYPFFPRCLSAFHSSICLHFFLLLLLPFAPNFRHLSFSPSLHPSIVCILAFVADRHEVLFSHFLFSAWHRRRRAIKAMSVKSSHQRDKQLPGRDRLKKTACSTTRQSGRRTSM